MWERLKRLKRGRWGQEERTEGANREMRSRVQGWMSGQGGVVGDATPLQVRETDRS